MSKPIAVDLFSGVGGMSLGFERAGFEVAAALDLDRLALESYALNFPTTTTLRANLASVSGSTIRALSNLANRQIDVVFGGPPCQGFSVIGKLASEDPRNHLLQHFARLVLELRPKYFVVENVAGLLASRHRRHVDLFTERVSEGGYGVVEPIQVLDASNYGVPQKRRRVFILGFLNQISEPAYPVPTTPNKSGPTVWDAISDLPSPSDPRVTGDTFFGRVVPTSPYGKSLSQSGPELSGFKPSIHSEDTKARFKNLLVGSSDPVSRFHRLSKTGLSTTLRAGTGRDRGSHTAPRPIHPEEGRCITVREGARLHSYPDWFQFNPTIWHGFMQLGNSVPPLLAEAVAQCIAAAVEDSRGRE